MKHLFKSLSVIALGLAALQAEAKFKVVTTFTVIQDIAQNVPLYEEVAKRTGCAYLSAQDIPGVENYPYDYMHLSPDAHKALAEHLAQWIPDYFSEEGK